MTAESRWRQRPDADVVDAGRRLHEYTDEGQAIVVAELRRRGLPVPEGPAAELPPPVPRTGCAACGHDTGPDDRYCASCGEPLAGTPPARPRGTAPRGPLVGRTHVALMIALTIVTGGLYYPYWFLSRRPLLNLLRSDEKVGVLPFAVAIALLAMNAAMTIMAVDATSGSVPAEPAAASPLQAVLELAFGVTMLVQSFKVRRMLESHLGRLPRPGEPRTPDDTWTASLSSLAVFFFGIFYLQHVVNTRLPDERVEVVAD